MNFTFATASQIVFGQGVANQLAEKAQTWGQRALVVTGSNPDRNGYLLRLLEQASIEITHFTVAQEPDIDLIQHGIEIGRQANVQFVIGLGGGSVIDAGKAIAAIVPNDAALMQYLEVVGAGQPLKAHPLPYIAIPTTAGTGAEVTKNAVISVPDKQVKVSLRNNRMLPDLALIDPELTYNLPQHLTASTGLDALTQVIEAYVSILANPITDALCEKGIELAGKALRTVYHQPDHFGARSDMMLVSLLGGLALANAKLGAVHGFAGALGGRTGAPHGAICGTLLPHVVAMNIDILRAKNSPILGRYQRVAQFLLSSHEATLPGLVDWLHARVQEFEIPSLSEMGMRKNQIDDIVALATKSSSMKGNSTRLHQAQLTQILENAY